MNKDYLTVQCLAPVGVEMRKRLQHLCQPDLLCTSLNRG